MGLCKTCTRPNVWLMGIFLKDYWSVWRIRGYCISIGLILRVAKLRKIRGFGFGLRGWKRCLTVPDSGKRSCQIPYRTKPQIAAIPTLQQRKTLQQNMKIAMPISWKAFASQETTIVGSGWRSRQTTSKPLMHVPPE